MVQRTLALFLADGHIGAHGVIITYTIIYISVLVVIKVKPKKPVAAFDTCSLHATKAMCAHPFRNHHHLDDVDVVHVYLLVSRILRSTSKELISPARKQKIITKDVVTE